MWRWVDGLGAASACSCRRCTRFVLSMALRTPADLRKNERMLAELMLHGTGRMAGHDFPSTGMGSH